MAPAGNLNAWSAGPDVCVNRLSPRPGQLRMVGTGQFVAEDDAGQGITAG
jgi:hypothetical protein